MFLCEEALSPKILRGRFMEKWLFFSGIFPLTISMIVAHITFFPYRCSKTDAMIERLNLPVAQQ